MSSLKSITQSVMLGVSDPDTLLVSAVVTGTAELGGLIPLTLDGREDACPSEMQPYISEVAAGLLKRILAGEYENTLPEFLSLAAARGLLAPPEALPSLLGLGKNELRALVLPVLGERGRWLAHYNPAWAYALASLAEADWETGSLAQRITLLENLRMIAPQRARELLQSTWETDPPEARAAFVSTFANGLGPQDEPFLETCLDDRRREVRDAARALLLRLPESRLVARAWARARPLLRLKSKFLAADCLEVSLPDNIDQAGKRDGLDGAPLRKKMGEKANLLARLLSLVPPALWSREFGRAPEKLVAAALDSEWREPVLLGWQLAAVAAGDVPWAGALAPLWATAEGRPLLGPENMDDLVQLLRVEKLEALVMASVKPRFAELDDKSLLVSLLEKYHRPWTVKMAQIVLHSAQRQSGELRNNLPLALPGFAFYLPPSLAEEFSSGWAKEPKGFWGAKIDEFLARLNFRRAFLEALSK